MWQELGGWKRSLSVEAEGGRRPITEAWYAMHRKAFGLDAASLRRL